jgi:hypothetical protein
LQRILEQLDQVELGVLRDFRESKVYVDKVSKDPKVLRVSRV